VRAYQERAAAKMDSTKVTVRKLGHNLMINDCPYAENAEERKKKVRMVQVIVSYKGKRSSMKCCAEHQDRAIEALK
jgi:hypothetical protein